MIRNKKQKLFFLLFAVLLIGSLLLTGCGKSNVGASDIKSVDDLKGATIGVQLGTTGDIYSSDYEKEGSTIVRFTKAADAVQALKQGKVDCIVLDESPASVFVKQNSDLSLLKEKFVKEDYAICVSKDNPELTAKMNTAISALKKDGTLKKIISNYIGDSTKGKYPYKSDESVKHDNGTLVVATNATFEPYEYMDGENVVGIDMDLMQAICDRLGMKLKVDNIEFDSIITAVESGKADAGIAGMTVTKDRLKSIDFTQSYTTATQVIIVRNGTVAKVPSIKSLFYNNFVKENRYMYIVNGLLTTLRITALALVIGLVIGFLVGMLRVTCDNTKRFRLLNLILKAYLTVLRGTPVITQLLIIYFVIFAASNLNPVLVATVAFGINSSAYIAELVRAGINSVDTGQMEAARSMGFNYNQSMRYFILPQAVKNVLPALGNEFIVLLKETAIAGYIGINDLTRGTDFIRSRTFQAYVPLLTGAFIYLCMVLLLSAGVSAMERRLNKDVR